MNKNLKYILFIITLFSLQSTLCGQSNQQNNGDVDPNKKQNKQIHISTDNQESSSENDDISNQNFSLSSTTNDDNKRQSKANNTTSPVRKDRSKLFQFCNNIYTTVNKSLKIYCKQNNITKSKIMKILNHLI